MPIPRRNQDNFFITFADKYGNQEENNQAIIYQPIEYVSFIPGSYFSPSFEFSTIHGADLRTLYHMLQSYFNQLVLNEQNRYYIGDNDHFIRDMKNIILKIKNNDSNYDSIRFEKCLTNFVKRFRHHDNIYLSKNLYIYIPKNTKIKEALGEELARKFRDNVLDYHKDLVTKMRKKFWYEQFKEFKIQQNYISNRINNQMIIVIKGKQRY